MKKENQSKMEKDPKVTFATDPLKGQIYNLTLTNSKNESTEFSIWEFRKILNHVKELGIFSDIFTADVEETTETNIAASEEDWGVNIEEGENERKLNLDDSGEKMQVGDDMYELIERVHVSDTTVSIYRTTGFDDRKYAIVTDEGLKSTTSTTAIILDRIRFFELRKMIVRFPHIVRKNALGAPVDEVYEDSTNPVPDYEYGNCYHSSHAVFIPYIDPENLDEDHEEIEIRSDNHFIYGNIPTIALREVMMGLISRNFISRSAIKKLYEQMDESEKADEEPIVSEKTEVTTTAENIYIGNTPEQDARAKNYIDKIRRLDTTDRFIILAVDDNLVDLITRYVGANPIQSLKMFPTRFVGIPIYKIPEKDRSDYLYGVLMQASGSYQNGEEVIFICSETVLSALSIQERNILTTARLDEFGYIYSGTATLVALQMIHGGLRIQ